MDLRTNSLFHTVGYKNHSGEYIFHSVVHKFHTVEQRTYQSILQKISKSSEGKY